MMLLSKLKLFDKWIIAIATCFILSILILISYFGVPISDESLIFAAALRFVQGQKPFIDDLSPLIPLSLLMQPLVKLSIFVHSGKNELILFTRHLFIIFQLIMGLYACYATKKYLPAFLVFLVTSIVVLYHPFGINNFHYDTLGVTLWTVILFQLYNFCYHKNNKLSDYVIFTFLNLLLFCSYPTFMFLLPVLYLVYFNSLQDKKTFWISHIVIGTLFLIFMYWYIFLHLNVHFEDLIKTIHFIKHTFNTHAQQLSIFKKFIIALERLSGSYSQYLLYSSILIFVSSVFKKKKIIFISLILITLFLPINYFISHKDVYEGMFYVLNSFGLLGGILFLFFLRKNLLAKRLFFCIWIPSLIGGLLTMTTSSNLALNFIIGFFPATILGLIYIYYTFEEYGSSEGQIIFPYILTRSIIIYGLLIIVLFQFRYTYGSPLIGLDLYSQSRFYPLNGPFKGLYFDPYWYDHIQQMQEDIRKIDTNKNIYIYFGPVSGGYLLVDNLQPGEPMLFCPYYINHFGEQTKVPHFIFFDKAFTLTKNDEYKNIYVTENVKHARVVFNVYYDIYATT